MSENAEAERALGQTVTAAFSVALNVAMHAHHRFAERAREAMRESEERQRQVANELAAELEMAAVQWHRIDEPDWYREHPDEVAQAWASACAWEPIDARAAEARAKFDYLLTAFYGERHPLVDWAREDEDYAALAHLVQRAVEVTPQRSETKTYESVPENEQREWLERAVWGPDSDPEQRIARSVELDALQQGLPVAVLREMPQESRQAWMQLRSMPEQDRREWRRQWLEREMWGPDVPDSVRLQRAEALEQLETGGSNAFEPEAWQAWVAEVREQAAQQPASTRQAAGAEAGADPETSASPSPSPVAAEPRAETQAERQERAAAAVREAWPEHIATSVVESRAFGAFAQRLHQLDERGYPYSEALGMVPSHHLVGTDRFGKPIRDSAALGEWHLEQLLSLPERGAAEAGIGELEAFVARHAETESDPTGESSDRSTQLHEAADGAEREAAIDHHGAAELSAPDPDHEAEPEHGQHAEQGAEPRSPWARPVEQTEPAQRAENAAGEHENTAETLRQGAYADGADPARLAGESHPDSVDHSLSSPRAQRRQGERPQARIQRAPQDRGR